MRRDFHSAVAANEIRSRDAIARFALLTGRAEQLLATAGETPAPRAANGLSAEEEADFRAFVLQRDTQREDRQKLIVKLLHGRRRVADFDAGDGNLLCLLRSRGVDAIGLTDTPRLVSAARGAGADIRIQTLDEFVAQLRPGECDAFVFDRLAERLSDAELRALVASAHRLLPANGIAIFTIANPASLRSRTSRRHSDVIAFLMEREFGNTAIVDGPAPRPLFIEGVAESAAETADLSGVVEHNAKQLNARFSIPDDLLLYATK